MIVRDAGRAAAVPVNSQIGLVPFYQFLLNHTHYDSIQTEDLVQKQRSLLVQQLKRLKEEPTTSVKMLNSIQHSNNPPPATKFSRSLAVVDSDASIALEEGLWLNGANGFQGKMLRVAHPPLSKAIEENQKRLSSSFLDGELTEEYFGEASDHSLFRERGLSGGMAKRTGDKQTAVGNKDKNKLITSRKDDEPVQEKAFGNHYVSSLFAVEEDQVNTAKAKTTLHEKKATENESLDYNAGLLGTKKAKTLPNWYLKRRDKPRTLDTYATFHANAFDPENYKFSRNDPICQARSRERALFPLPETGIASTDSRKLPRKTPFVDGSFTYNWHNFAPSDLLQSFEPTENQGRGASYHYLAIRSFLEPRNSTTDCEVKDPVLTQVPHPLMTYGHDVDKFQQMLDVYANVFALHVKPEQVHDLQRRMFTVKTFLEQRKEILPQIEADFSKPEEREMALVQNLGQPPTDLNLQYLLHDWQQTHFEIAYLRELTKARVFDRASVISTRLRNFPGENHWDPIKCLEVEKNFAGSVAAVFGNSFSWNNATQGQALEYLGRPLAGHRAPVMPWAQTRPGTSPAHSVDIASAAVQTVNCEILNNMILSNYFLPKIWYLPFNPLVPPPLEQIAQGLQEHVEREEWGDHVTHCSLQVLVDMLKPFGYQLLQIDHAYAVFKHKSYVVKELDHPERQLSVFDHWLDGWFCSPWKTMAFQRLEYNFLYSEELGLYRRARFYWADFLLRKTRIPKDIVSSGLALHGGDVFGKGEVLESFPSLYSFLVHRLFPKRFYHKHPGPGVDTFIENSNRGRCVRREPNSQRICECFAPYRGPLCGEEELRSEAFEKTLPTNENKHAIYYLLDHGEDHLWELQHALSNLWNNFNKYFDYPVLIWHVGISREQELQFLNNGGASKVLKDDFDDQEFAAWRKRMNKPAVSEETTTQIEAYLIRREEEEEYLEWKKEQERKLQAKTAASKDKKTKAPAPAPSKEAEEDDLVLEKVKRLAHFRTDHNSEARVFRFENADEFYEQAKQMRQHAQPAGTIFVSRGRNGHLKSVGADVKVDSEYGQDISLLDIVAKSKNRIWLHLREKPELPILPNMDRQDHHRSYPWLEMIHFRSGPLYLTSVMQRFHLSWWLDTDAYFPNDAKGYDPFADFEHKNLVLQQRSKKYFLKNHLDDFLAQVKEENGVFEEQDQNRDGGSKKKNAVKTTSSSSSSSTAVLQQAKQTFVEHVNDFVSDLELAWGYKILYRSQKTAALQQLWEITNFWALQHRHLMESKLFTYPNRQLRLPMQQLDGPSARQLRREGKTLEVIEREDKTLEEKRRNRKDDDEEDEDEAEELDSGGKPLNEFKSLFDEVVVITFEYPQGNALSGGCVMPNAITNSKYTGTPDTLYQRYVKYLNSLHGMFQIHGWGDHIVQTIGFAVLMRPLEVALNHSLVWNMTRLPYAHQHFVDCVAGHPVKVWDPDTGDIWEFRWKFERSSFYKNKTNAIDREYNEAERYIVLQQDQQVIKGTLNVNYLHLLPEKWNWRKPFFACE
ncbi:unnamed protein product [Amoebophrya sp. A120]|nr:unnamed protein product [Amoebophrya sp. A120]|eukprot:GSA120T00003725001.1